MRKRVCSLLILLPGFLALAGAQDGAPDSPVDPAPASPGPSSAPGPEGAEAGRESKPPGEGDSPGARPQVPPEILGALGREQYKLRIDAQHALLKWGREDVDGSIETLYQVYRSAEDPEVRLRSREVLKQLVIIKQPFDGKGYLGIRMEPAQWKNERGQFVPAVRISEVREGTAAELAKLQADDLIIGVDALVLDDLTPTRLFAEYIESKKPADEITLRIVRADERLDLKASLRRRSPLLDEANQLGAFFFFPDQSELDEEDFQDWLRMRAEAERIRNKT